MEAAGRRAVPWWTLYSEPSYSEPSGLWRSGLRDLAAFFCLGVLPGSCPVPARVRSELDNLMRCSSVGEAVIR